MKQLNIEEMKNVNGGGGKKGYKYKFTYWAYCKTCHWERKHKGCKGFGTTKSAARKDAIDKVVNFGGTNKHKKHRIVCFENN